MVEEQKDEVGTEVERGVSLSGFFLFRRRRRDFALLWLL